MNIDRYISRLRQDKLTVFLFHGVISKPSNTLRNYNNKHILEKDFYDLINKLSHTGSPVSLDYFLSGKKMPSSPYAITFDDGFENNFSVAMPILREFETPATFYITSSFIENNHMSWIDQIEHAISRTKLPKIRYFNKEFELKKFTQKIKFLDFVRKRVKGNANIFANRLNYVKDIFELCKVEYCNSMSTEIDKKMNFKQISSLAKTKLFTIGGHTFNHPILSFLNDKELDFEIKNSIEMLQNLSSEKVVHFSYPEGLDFCFNEKVIERLKFYGIQCCPTAIDGLNNFDEDPFYLKRITVT